MKKGKLNVILLGIVSLINDFSSEMIIPILPLFITSLGGTAITIGLIGGLRDFISNIMKVFVGFWSDKIGKRKIFIFSGYFLSSIFKFLLAFSVIWYQVLFFVGIERLGKGIRDPPRDALISESMKKNRGAAFGIQRSFDTTGAILGSIAVLIFLMMGLTFKNIIIIAAVIGFFSLIPILIVRERKTKPKKISITSIKKLPKSFKVFMIIAGVFALANFSYMFFILKANLLFKSTKYALIFPILLYILFNFFYALLAAPFGRLSDRIGKKKILLIGYSLFSLVCLGFWISNSLSMFIIFFSLYGVSYSIIIAQQTALASDLATESLKATALGAFHTTTGLIALLSSLIAGILWTVNPNITFIFGSLTSLTAFFLLLYKKL